MTYTIGMGDIPYKWPGNIDSDFNLEIQQIPFEPSNYHSSVPL